MMGYNVVLLKHKSDFAFLKHKTLSDMLCKAVMLRTFTYHAFTSEL